MIELLELLVVCACGFLLIMGGQFFWCWWVHDGEQRKQEVDIMQYTIMAAEDKWRTGDGLNGPYNLTPDVFSKVLLTQRRLALRLYQLCKALEGDPTFSGPEIKDD